MSPERIVSVHWPRELVEKTAAARDKADAQKRLREKLAVIQAEAPGLALAQAWAQLKRLEPLLIAHCQVVEARL